MNESGEGIIPQVRQQIKDSIYGQEDSWKNAASRWVVDKLSSPENRKQDEALARLENMAGQLKGVWESPDAKNKLTEDRGEWRSRDCHGNYQRTEFQYKGRGCDAKFSSWSGIISHQDYWGNLNRVDGYVGAGEMEGEHFSSAAYFCVDMEKPLIRENQTRQFAEVKLSGAQLLPQEIRQHNIESVKVGLDGLEVHVNQFDRRLSFSDRTEASVWYVAGTQVDDKHYDRKVTISPHGPIHEVKLLISSAQRTWARDAQHIEGASNWLTMRLGDNGQWLPADMSDKWARHMSTTGETLENGDVRVQMKVFDEVKEIILPKIDLNTVLDTSQNLVNAIVNGK